MAEIKFLTPINYTGNELRNFAHQSVAVLPDATLRKFQVVGFNNSLYWSTGTVWYRIGQVVGALEENLDAGNFKITNVADAVAPTDAASLKIVQREIAAVVDAAPALLDTLKELADALNNDPDFANNVLAMTSALRTDVDAQELRIDALENGTAGNLARKFAGPVGDGTATDFVLLHSLGTTDVSVSLFDATTNELVLAGVTATNPNNVTISFSQAPTANAYRATVFG